MDTRKPPVTFAAMLVRAQRRFQAVGRATAMMAFPGAELQRMPVPVPVRPAPQRRARSE